VLLSLSVPTGVGEHSVTHAEARNRLTNLDELTGDVGA